MRENGQIRMSDWIIADLRKAYLVYKQTSRKIRHQIRHQQIIHQPLSNTSHTTITTNSLNLHRVPVMMAVYKKYRQLRFNVDVLQDHYEAVHLQFRLYGRQVKGTLQGNFRDWNFTSSSPLFLRFIPGGVLYKYNLWLQPVPGQLSDIYNAIDEAARKAGYDLSEKEEW